MKLRNFEMIFKGSPTFSAEGDKVGCELILSGCNGGEELEEMAKLLAGYADGMLKQKKEPRLAMILLMAYSEFERLNPDMTEQAEVALGATPRSGAIIKPHFGK